MRFHLYTHITTHNNTLVSSRFTHTAQISSWTGNGGSNNIHQQWRIYTRRRKKKIGTFGLGKSGASTNRHQENQGSKKDTRTLFSSGKVINRHQGINGARGEQGQFFHLARTRKGTINISLQWSVAHKQSHTKEGSYQSRHDPGGFCWQ